MLLCRKRVLNTLATRIRIVMFVHTSILDAGINSGYTCVVMRCYGMIYDVMLCCVMCWYGMLRPTLLCYVMVCYAV